MPPLKSKLIGGPGTLFNGVSSNGQTNGDNCDSMSINGSIVSNGSVTSIAGATNGVQHGGGHPASLTNGHINGHNVHTNGMATLPLVRPTTGDNSRNSTTLESPKHDSSAQQNGKNIASSLSLRLTQPLLRFHLLPSQTKDNGGDSRASDETLHEQTDSVRAS